MQINIKADVSQALRENEANRKRVLQAAVRSLNRTADQVRTAGVKSISAELGTKQKTVREQLRVIRATRSKLASIVVGTGKAIGLIHFHARQTAAGVVVTLYGKKKLFKGAFIQTMPGGHRGIFRRRHGTGWSKGRPRTSSPNLPIREMWGPGVPGTMASKHIFEALEKHARTRWPINFAADLKYYLNKP